MDVEAVMEALEARLGSIDGLRVFGWPVGSVTPPAAIVTYPETVRFDESYRRGADVMDPQVIILVPRPVDRSSRGMISGYVSGSGTQSVKRALESGPCDAWGSIRVTQAVIDGVTWGGTDYVGAIFTCEIIGQGG